MLAGEKQIESKAHLSKTTKGEVKAADTTGCMRCLCKLMPDTAQSAGRRDGGGEQGAPEQGDGQAPQTPMAAQAQLTKEMQKHQADFHGRSLS